MNKLFGIAVAFAMVFSVTSIAGARGMVWHMPSTDIEVENEGTSVTTVAKADVDTGSISQWGGKMAFVSTGDVYMVGAFATSNVNTSLFPACTTCRMMGGDTEVENEWTRVKTIAKADVETGNVTQWSFGGFQTAFTGDVSTVQADAEAFVNYTNFSVK